MTKKAIFGAGCFWGVESAFRKVKGVVSTTAGYAGGTIDHPTYQDVCTGRTGHAEVVEVEYDPKVVSYEQLLAIFWQIHDPTTLNRQGPDVGSQYRSIILYLDQDQEQKAKRSKELLEDSKKFKKAVVTEIQPATSFYKAEDYHQQYFEKRGMEGGCHIF
jgi:peptide-methionine (S)-S-oxide reductase